MNPQEVRCPNLDCPASGQAGKGNIGVHSKKEQRYRCHVCHKTFAQRAPARTGTIFHRRRTDAALIILVISLVSWGCPLVALEHAFGLQPQTLRDWLEAARKHAEAVHHQQVVQPRDLGQVQADEVRVTTQCGSVWLAMALLVSTRLWLGGVISTRRDQVLITRLVSIIAACALVAPLLLVVDGFTSYIDALRRAFRTREHPGGRGAPRNVLWADLTIGQVVKEYAGKRVVGVRRRLVQGSAASGAADGPDARVFGPQHGRYRAPHWHVSSTSGALGAQDAPSGAAQGDAAGGDVSGGRALQLLHAAREPAAGERSAADPGDGGGAHGSLLVGPRVVVASGCSAALAATQAARAALQSDAGADCAMGSRLTTVPHSLT